MTTPNARRLFRPKAHTWLARDARPDDPHVSVDPRSPVVMSGGYCEEGRFVVVRQEEDGEALWVGDPRHWTEVPPKPTP
jgi:hypothetical protein